MWKEVSRPDWMVKQRERLEEGRAKEIEQRDAWFAQQWAKEDGESEGGANKLAVDQRLLVLESKVGIFPLVVAS